MEKATIKMYKDNSSNELIISISPLSKNIEDLVASLLSEVMKQPSNEKSANEETSSETVVPIKDVPNIKTDEAYINKEQDYKKEQERITFKFTEGENIGKTPQEVLNEKNGLHTIVAICLKAKDKTTQEYISCAKALKDFINNSIKKEQYDDLYAVYQIVCPNLIKHCTLKKLAPNNIDEDTTQGKKIIVTFCSGKLLQNL